MYFNKNIEPVFSFSKKIVDEFIQANKEKKNIQHEKIISADIYLVIKKALPVKEKKNSPILYYTTSSTIELTPETYNIRDKAVYDSDDACYYYTSYQQKKLFQYEYEKIQGAEEIIKNGIKQYVYYAKSHNQPEEQNAILAGKKIIQADDKVVYEYNPIIRERYNEEMMAIVKGATKIVSDLLDEQGNKIPELDSDGNPKRDADGNIIYKKKITYKYNLTSDGVPTEIVKTEAQWQEIIDAPKNGYWEETKKTILYLYEVIKQKTNSDGTLAIETIPEYLYNAIKNAISIKIEGEYNGEHVSNIFYQYIDVESEENIFYDEKEYNEKKNAQLDPNNPPHYIYESLEKKIKVTQEEKDQLNSAVAVKDKHGKITAYVITTDSYKISVEEYNMTKTAKPKYKDGAQIGYSYFWYEEKEFDKNLSHEDKKNLVVKILHKNENLFVSVLGADIDALSGITLKEIGMKYLFTDWSMSEKFRRRRRKRRMTHHGERLQYEYVKTVNLGEFVSVNLYRAKIKKVCTVNYTAIKKSITYISAAWTQVHEQYKDWKYCIGRRKWCGDCPGARVHCGWTRGNNKWCCLTETEYHTTTTTKIVDDYACTDASYYVVEMQNRACITYADNYQDIYNLCRVEGGKYLPVKQVYKNSIREKMGNLNWDENRGEIIGDPYSKSYNDMYFAPGEITKNNPLYEQVKNEWGLEECPDLCSLTTKSFTDVVTNQVYEYKARSDTSYIEGTSQMIQPRPCWQKRN